MKRISIIIPVYNGDEFLESFFKPFENRTDFNEIEVLIIDNHSSNIFLTTLRLKALKFDFIFVYSYNDKKSSYAARNYGFSKAKGEIIAFTDFDCLLTEKYIKELINFPIIETNLVSGRIELFHVKNNIYEIFDRHAYLKQEEYFDNNYAATANLVLNRNTFSKLKGFKELTSGGDNEFCKRAIINGFCINYNEDLLIKHPLRGTYVGHINKAKRLGKGHGQLFKIKKSNGIQKTMFFIKTLFGIFVPLHQMLIFYRIIKNERVKTKNIFPLFILCYSVGFFQRIEIIKKAI